MFTRSNGAADTTIGTSKKGHTEAVLKQDLHLTGGESEVDRSTTGHGLQPRSRASGGNRLEAKSVAKRSSRNQAIERKQVQTMRELPLGRRRILFEKQVHLRVRHLSSCRVQLLLIGVKS